MAIPSAELTLAQGIQSDLANGKGTMIAARNKAEQLRVIAQTAGDVIGANLAFAVKNALGKAWMEIEAAHVSATNALVAQYGAANAGPVVLGGGGGR